MALEPIRDIAWAKVAKRMNDYSQYTPERCDGHECICDCERCSYARYEDDEQVSKYKDRNI